ncbi:MAG: cob(I)yrinic acid a,c-diamide adenosyltransferase [Christensenellales bacterium]|jgi:cob(I)alamin adenosyltransferase|nr:cob(I)yrinic acid a,c-diamide adenosyltransferase [Clostridiales bacterium]
MNLLHVYTGEGKGKSTAAMGLACRMLGHDRPVIIIQFMKPGTSGELISLRKLGAIIYPAPAQKKFTFQMDEEELVQAGKEMKLAIDQMIERIDEVKPALTVLDELATAMSFYLVPKVDGFRLIDAALKHGDVAVTGRGAGEDLFEKANYVSIIEARKHPFEEGISARKGIEW